MPSNLYTNRFTECFIAFALISTGSFAKAQILVEEPLQISALDEIFIAPNEKHPQKAREILKNAPEGVMIAVGTERGFIDAALAPNVTQVVLLDRTKEVVGYNRINALLLGISKSREDYLYLRLQASQEVWKLRLDQSTLNSAGAQKTLAASQWTIWQRDVRESLLYDFADLHRIWPKGTRQCPECFDGANYLYDEILFERIAKLARSGAIEAHQVDLGRPSDVGRVFAAIEAKKLKISLFDLSNAWEEQYLKPDQLKGLLGNVVKHSHKKGIFLITSTGNFGQSFDYYGFGVDYMQSFPELAQFIKSHLITRGYVDGVVNGLTAGPLGACQHLESAGSQAR